jgi:hypothetical protein
MTSEQAHLLRVKELPCAICIHMGLIPQSEQTGQSEAHHILDSSSRSDWLTISLCAEHHRGATGFHGLGQRAWERRYRMTEVQALAWTLKRLFSAD